MKHGPAIKPLPAALRRALRELQRSRIAQAEAPPPATPAPPPPGPALDLDAMQASAQRRLRDWIDDEASRIAVTLAQLSRRQQRMVEVWRMGQPEPEWIAA
jgi:hypothetical protein